MKFHPYAAEVPEEPKSRGAAKDYEIQADHASVILTQGQARYRLPDLQPRLRRDGLPPRPAADPRGGHRAVPGQRRRLILRPAARHRRRRRCG